MTAIDRLVQHRLWFSFQIDHAEGARSPRLVSAGGEIERRIARPFDSSTGHPADVVRSGGNYVVARPPKTAAFAEDR
jgi:hypothetical protein